MPQLSQLELVYLSQWFWLLLVLGAIYFFVGRGIVPKVEETVDRRDAKIAADLAEAERLRGEADAAEETWRQKMNAAHSQAQATTAAAKEQASTAADERLRAVDARLAAKADEAAAALGRARQAALAEVEAMASEATSEIVAKLTGAKVDAKSARAAVAEAFSRA